MMSLVHPLALLDLISDQDPTLAKQASTKTNNHERRAS
jgi:hypothetical protein